MAKKVYKRTFSAVTTNATPLSPAWSMSVPDNTLWSVAMVCIGRDRAGTERCQYRRHELVYRHGGGAAVEAAFEVVGTDYETSAGLDATIGVSSNDVGGSVTGKAGTTIDWIINIEITEAP
jgi:hypothetical protein